MWRLASSEIFEPNRPILASTRASRYTSPAGHGGVDLLSDHLGQLSFHLLKKAWKQHEPKIAISHFWHNFHIRTPIRPIQKATGNGVLHNVSVVYLTENPVQHQRTKHIELDIHFVRDKVRLGAIKVLHVPTDYQYADIFTKGLPKHLFHRFRSSLCLRNLPSKTAGEC
ncbi:hypothetical protein OSB04_017040 [Centaurea solstitialis]|uniref:Uncharacterized protein n=1 Tax=Centaurea solstitialis TaxID=347529 RepID=A0AA38WI11_9ASTR|nr:hypothetical protein OSB04_017040 [Centaurea solstitialis]